MAMMVGVKKQNPPRWLVLMGILIIYTCHATLDISRVCLTVAHAEWGVGSRFFLLRWSSPIWFVNSSCMNTYILSNSRIWERTQYIHVFNRDWTKCSNIVDQYELNNQHPWGRQYIYDHSIRERIFTLTKESHSSSKITRNMATSTLQIC